MSSRNTKFCLLSSRLILGRSVSKTKSTIPITGEFTESEKKQHDTPTKSKNIALKHEPYSIKKYSMSFPKNSSKKSSPRHKLGDSEEAINFYRQAELVVDSASRTGLVSSIIKDKNNLFHNINVLNDENEPVKLLLKSCINSDLISLATIAPPHLVAPESQANPLLHKYSNMQQNTIVKSSSLFHALQTLSDLHRQGEETFLHVTPRFNLERVSKLDFYDIVVVSEPGQRSLTTKRKNKGT